MKPPRRSPKSTPSETLEGVIRQANQGALGGVCAYPLPMLLTAHQAVTFANDLARGFGLTDAEGAPLELPEPRDDRRVTDLIRRLRAALAVVRPVATAPSIAEALGAVIESNSRTARRNLAELDALFVKATGRAKRADRARLFAQLLVLFDLEKAVGVAAGGDLEETLERVRHGMEKWRRRAR